MTMKTIFDGTYGRLASERALFKRDYINSFNKTPTEEELDNYIMYRNNLDFETTVDDIKLTEAKNGKKTYNVSGIGQIVGFAEVIAQCCEGGDTIIYLKDDKFEITTHYPDETKVYEVTTVQSINTYKQ